MSEITPASVTQGKTWDNKEECCAAANAADKDLSTNAATATDNGAGWLKLQLDTNHYIHKIVIYRRFYTGWYYPDGHCAKSEKIFKECIDNENNVDVSVYKGEVQQKSCGTLKLTYGLEQSVQVYTLLCNVEGDTVKLSKNSGAITVQEIVVVGASKLKKNYSKVLI